MTVTDPFLFLAGQMAIDFVNTEVMLRGEPADLLRSEGDLVRWLVESGGPRLRARAGWLKEAKELRGTCGGRASISLAEESCGSPTSSPSYACWGPLQVRCL